MSADHEQTHGIHVASSPAYSMKYLSKDIKENGQNAQIQKLRGERGGVAKLKSYAAFLQSLMATCFQLMLSTMLESDTAPDQVSTSALFGTMDRPWAIVHLVF